MNRGFSPAQERGLIVLVALAIIAAGISFLIPTVRRPQIPPPREIVVPGVHLIVPRFLASAPKVDVNNAGVEELMRLPGIGEVLARRIVAYREEHGPFESVDDLENVEGIGEKTLERIRERVVCGGT